MSKRYFGSFALQNTARKVKEVFPECRIFYNETETGKEVSFKFDSENRKKYKLSEGYRTYSFLNGHLILSNGPMDPFKYDALDSLIEASELQHEVNRQRESVMKIRNAIEGCVDFFNSAVIKFGNRNGSEYDVKFELNGTMRAYRMDLESDSVHMDKIDPDVELAGEQEYKLSKLGPKIVYKVLKTSHPGLKTSATEYISGMREDKSLWKSAEDAYIKPWRKEVYEALGIRPLDVLSDIKESLLVGEFVDNPMRHLILFAGMKSEEPEMVEFSYRDVPLEAVPYSEYKAKRDKILKQYKLAVMRVCRETGVIASKAIEVMNAYRGKPQGPVVLRPSDEAIREIRMAILKDPAAEVVNKIVRAIKLHNHEIGFTAFLRRSHCGGSNILTLMRMERLQKSTSTC